MRRFAAVLLAATCTLIDSHTLAFAQGGGVLADIVWSRDRRQWCHAESMTQTVEGGRSILLSRALSAQFVSQRGRGRAIGQCSFVLRFSSPLPSAQRLRLNLRVQAEKSLWSTLRYEIRLNAARDQVAWGAGSETSAGPQQRVLFLQLRKGDKEVDVSVRAIAIGDYDNDRASLLVDSLSLSLVDDDGAVSRSPTTTSGAVQPLGVAHQPRTILVAGTSGGAPQPSTSANGSP